MPNRDIVVVGASAGGIEALMELARVLPPDFPGSVMVVYHVSEASRGHLAKMLDAAGPLPSALVEDGEEIRPGRIYVSRAGQHMLVREGRLHLSRGPRENGHRPAVDALFRSAALHYGSRVVGVVLSGALDDGTAGLEVVKACGGVALVQNPEEAVFPEMPLNALRNVDVDEALSIAQMGEALNRLAYSQADLRSHDHSPWMDYGKRVSEQMVRSDPDTLDRLGKHTNFVCPECQGPLWELNDSKVLQFRCHLGHGFSGESLLAKQSASVEGALWVALRALEEHARLQRRMADRARSHERMEHARSYEQNEVRVEEGIETLWRLLTGYGQVSDDSETPTAGAAN